MKKKVVILSGAGISAESGIQTFRDSDGLWHNHKIEDVCTPTAWAKDPSKVNDFYNMRRIDVLNNKPNKAHMDIVKFEDIFDISIVTTNVDNYHELAGSSNVLHLHGEILKARSSSEKYDWSGMSPDRNINNPKLYDVGREGLNYYRDYADDDFPLRPHIVWFGESVPKLQDAIDIMKQADYLIIVGTSLSVYPVATLMYDVPNHCKIYYVDPNADIDKQGTINIKEKATIGVEKAFNYILLEEF